MSGRHKKILTLFFMKTSPCLSLLADSAKREGESKPVTNPTQLFTAVNKTLTKLLRWKLEHFQQNMLSVIKVEPTLTSNLLHSG